jgi:ADP-ribose pyrophosphatase YjhB (NUDIX family)
MVLLLLVAAAALLVLGVWIVAAPAPRRRRRGKWTSAGGIVVDRRGRIAVVRQRNRRRRWRWTLPKGRIDPGETEEAAALREVHEESGLRARIVGLLVRHEGRLHHTCLFEMALVEDDGVHDRETREVRLVTVRQAATLLRGRRDLLALRRLIERRTRVVSEAIPEGAKVTAAPEGRKVTADPEGRKVTVAPEGRR